MHNDLPDFLNRKLNPQTPATNEELIADAGTLQPIIDKPRFGPDPEVLEAERKEKARERVAKLKVQLVAKSNGKAQSWRKIPDKHLKWDTTKLRFVDRRVMYERKLAAASKELVCCQRAHSPPVPRLPRVANGPGAFSKERSMSAWTPEVIVESGGKWTGNAMRFATEIEALDYAFDLSCRWMGVRDYRAVETDLPVNYRWKDGKAEYIKDWSEQREREIYDRAPELLK